MHLLGNLFYNLYPALLIMGWVISLFGLLASLAIGSIGSIMAQINFIDLSREV